MKSATGHVPEHVPHWMQVFKGLPCEACNKLDTSSLKEGLVAIGFS